MILRAPRTFALLLAALLPAAASGVDPQPAPKAAAPQPAGPQPAAPSAVRSVGTAAGARVGPETCKACHTAAYEVWRVGPHARAFEALPAQNRKDPRCLSCHSPDADAGLSGITCEACHGPGSLYAAPYVMRDPELARLLGLADPGEKACLACHGESAPSLVRFEYAKKLPLIDHWTKGRAPAAAPAQPAPAKPAAPAKGT
ncbi:MAG TPA: multiheme c-type cytochrome [Anaeromyxobacter sp.]|nr:multiheme c-type cytochrome [Anaeromyxobacter sp.]